jgi:hypothetical protein
VSSNAMARGVLNVKPKGQPKKLQLWQAYQALTYESKWKPDVDMAWSEYKNAWTSKHPDEKPPKNRFQIMIEFMKQKFEMESEDMKIRCEEYREHQLEDNSDSTKNAEFQK